MGALRHKCPESPIYATFRIPIGSFPGPFALTLRYLRTNGVRELSAAFSLEPRRDDQDERRVSNPHLFIPKTELCYRQTYNHPPNGDLRMNETILFYATITIFGFIYIALALLPRKQIKSKKDYFLAGRNLGVFKATCTLIATQLGAGLLLGTSQQAFAMGLYGLLFTVGISTGLVILGCGLAGKLRALNIVTTTQVFEMKYHSRLLRKIASFLVTVTLCGILVGNIVASKLLLHSLNFQSDFFFISFWLFIIIYTMLGGLHAVVLTDLMQVSFIVLIFGGITIYSLMTSSFDFFSMSALESMQAKFTGHLPDASHLLIVLAMPALFALFEQDLAQIFFASRSKTVATVTAILTTIFMLSFGLIPIYFGMQAHLMGITTAAHTSPLIFVIRAIAGNVMAIMAASGILAAIASTADALLCAIGANITQDFSLSFLGFTSLVESKLTTFTMGIAILGLSYLMPTDIIYILTSSYQIPVSCLLIPILFAYFAKTARAYAAYGSIIGGAIGLALFYVWPIPFYPIYTLGLSLVGFVAGHFVEGAPPVPATPHTAQ